MLGLQFIYFFALEAATGQTVGKRAFHVRVVALDGTPLSIRQSAIRNVFALYRYGPDSLRVGSAVDDPHRSQATPANR